MAATSCSVSPGSSGAGSMVTALLVRTRPAETTTARADPASTSTTRSTAPSKSMLIRLSQVRVSNTESGHREISRVTPGHGFSGQPHLRVLEQRDVLRDTATADLRALRVQADGRRGDGPDQRDGLLERVGRGVRQVDAQQVHAARVERLDHIGTKR